MPGGGRVRDGAAGVKGARRVKPGDLRRLGDVLARLEDAIDDAGGVRAVAKAWGCSAALVSDVRLRKRRPGPKILTRLGLREVIFIRYAPASTAGGRPRARARHPQRPARGLA